MTSDEYADELRSLRDAINGFKACISWDERNNESPWLERQWRRVVLTTQPARLPARYREMYDSLTKEAADRLNAWYIEHAAGKPEAETRPEPPAKAMADTMRFCAMSKKYGF